jgi:hypothetical protein
MYLLARKHRIALILDETYSDFIREQPHELFTIPFGINADPAHVIRQNTLTGYRADCWRLLEHNAIPENSGQYGGLSAAHPQMAVKYGVENWMTGLKQIV